MIRPIIINLFLIIPNFLVKLFFWKKPPKIRNQYFDIQSYLYINLIPKLNLYKILDTQIPYIRNLIEKGRSKYRLSAKPKNKVQINDFFISIDENKKILLREYVPKNISTNKVILYFHGGGYVLNSVDIYDDAVSFFSDCLNARIFSLDYSLSPESKFPEALNESIKALDWLNNKGYKSNEISFCGDSAGAHLAASLNYSLIEENKESSYSQLLMYPMCDPSCSSESHSLYKDGFLLSHKDMKWFWNKLMLHQKDCENAKFNLLKTSKIKNYPKTLIVTAGFDPLCDEAAEFENIIKNQGAIVKRLHYPSLFHGFASLTRLKEPYVSVMDFLLEYKKLL